MNIAPEERAIRLEKIKKLREEGIDPYPSKFDKKHSLQDAFELPDGKKTKTAGRLMTIRDMGKLCFAHLMDESRKMQIALRVDATGKESYARFLKTIDIGDIIGIEGEIFTTRKGEKTIL